MKASMISKLINSAAFGIAFSIVTLGGTLTYAYYIALEIHTTGSALVALFN